MKKSLLAIGVAALCAMPSGASAQGFGVLGGLAYGSVPNSNTSGQGSLSANNGFAFGLGAQSGGPIGFGINGLYSQRGFKSDLAGFSQKLSYIDVPVYLRVAVPNPVVVPFALIGPQVSFELNCDSDGGNCPSGRPKTTYAGIAAIGIKFPTLARLSVQARYIYGLTNLDFGTVNNQSNYKPRSFMLLFGLGL